MQTYIRFLTIRKNTFITFAKTKNRKRRHSYRQVRTLHYITLYSLFSDTKKEEKTSSINISKQQTATTTFTQDGSNIIWGVLSHCGLYPPPHPVHLRPPAFIQHIHTYGYTDRPKKNFFLPNKQHMRTQTLTGLYRPKLWKKSYSFFFKNLQLAAPPVVLLAVHSSYPSLCPLAILVQVTNLVTICLLITSKTTLSIKDDPFK